MSKKITDIDLIENRKKKKKNIDLFEGYKEDLFNAIDNIIDLPFNNNSINIKSDEYIKDNLLKFIETYINISRNIRKINEEDKIIKSIINQLLDNVVERCHKIDISNFEKELTLIKDKRYTVEKYDKIIMLDKI